MIGKLHIVLKALPAVAFAVALAWVQLLYLGSLGGKAVETPRFSLIDHHGRPVTEADLRGRHTIMYFGYTFCPDICPTSLGILTDALERLGPAAERLTPVLVSFDPERDTPKVLADYVAAFGPRFVGMTGDGTQVAEAARQFGVIYKRFGDGPDYVIDHSADFYLLGPDGWVIATFRHGINGEELASRLREAL